MEMACASVSRVAQKKQQEPQTFNKYPSGTHTREIGGGENESPHVNSHKIEFPGASLWVKLWATTWSTLGGGGVQT